MDKEGHVVIIDFGFSKKITERSSTLRDTQKYLAPEIIDKGLDWWALESLSMKCFQDIVLISQKILTEKIQWPRNINAAAKDLIEKLLERDRTKRLVQQMEQRLSRITGNKQRRYVCSCKYISVFSKQLTGKKFITKG